MEASAHDTAAQLKGLVSALDGTPLELLQVVGEEEEEDDEEDDDGEDEEDDEEEEEEDDDDGEEVPQKLYIQTPDRPPQRLLLVSFWST